MSFARTELALQPAPGDRRMNRRLLNILLIAFVIAAGCSFIVYRLIGDRLGARQTTTRVIAAANDVKLGSVLRDADLKTVEIVGTLPKGVILKRQDAIGRGVVSNLYGGEPVLESRLAAPGSGGGLAATIPQGMRASAVKVNDVVGVAGFCHSGDARRCIDHRQSARGSEYWTGTDGQNAPPKHRGSVRRYRHSAGC